jgi:hypothetical protein
MEADPASEICFFFLIYTRQILKEGECLCESYQSQSLIALDLHVLLERQPFVYSDQELCMACHASLHVMPRYLMAAFSYLLDDIQNIFFL